MSTSPFGPIEEAIEVIRNGGMVVVVDDEDRENEGDIIMAADAVTPEHLAFIVRQASGLVCVSITEDDAARLQLPAMVERAGTKAGNKGVEAAMAAFETALVLRSIG